MEKDSRCSASSGIATLDFKRIYFVGTGSSFWVAKIAEFLWRECTKTGQCNTQL